MKRTLFVLASLMALSLPAGAQTIKISVSQQGQELQGITRPTTGMTKQAVEDAFGPPQAITGPVGEPPISTWVYADYSVYFERDRVIHTVLKAKAP